MVLWILKEPWVPVPFLYIAEYNKNRQFLFFGRKKKPNSKNQRTTNYSYFKNLKEFGGFHERTGSSLTPNFLFHPQFFLAGGGNWALKATSLAYFMNALLILISTLNPRINHEDCHGSLIMHLWGYFGHWIRTPNFGNKQSYQVAERLLNLGAIGFVVLHARPKTMKPGIKWHLHWWHEFDLLATP